MRSLRIEKKDIKLFTPLKLRSHEEYDLGLCHGDEQDTREESKGNKQTDSLTLSKISSQTSEMTDQNGINDNYSESYFGSPLHIGKPIRKSESNNAVMVMNKLSNKSPTAMNKRELFKMKLS